MASLGIVKLLLLYFILQAPQLSGSHVLLEAMSNELKQFYNFMVKFGKTYGNPAEQAKRFDIFKINLKIIEDLNKNIHDFAEYGVTKFSDLTPEEFESQMFPQKNNQKMEGTKRLEEHWTVPEIPDLVSQLQPRGLPSISDNSNRRDFCSWIADNPFYPVVEDQAKTGLCTVFSVAGALSIIYSDDQKQRISLSKQQVADCASYFVGEERYTYGRVYNYLKDNYLATEADYPFKRDRKVRPCKTEAVAKGVVTVTDYTVYKTERNIKASLRQAPLVTTVIGQNLQHYRSGVITDCPEVQASHAVTMVEYGIETLSNGRDIPYYLLRNSWGPDFGILNGEACNFSNGDTWFQLLPSSS